MSELDLRKLFVEHEVVISVDGDHVLAIEKPAQVTLPLVKYPGDVEQAVQERLQAILEAIVNQNLPGPLVPAESAVTTLIEQLGDHPLRAIIAGELTQLRLPASDWDQAPFYAYEGMSEDVVYGITEPKRVGHIVTDADTGAIGIICIGGIVSVKLAQD